MRSLLTAAACTVLVAASVAYAATETYVVDPEHSTVLFKIKHMGLSYTYGRFNDVAGSFLIDDADASKSSVKITIQAASIDTNSVKRDAHLKGPDFFSVKEFPTITFKSTAVKREGDLYTITGDMTLHGVTKSVIVKATRVGTGKGPRGDQRTGFDMQVTIKRSEFGMKNMLGGIGDEVQLTIGIEAIRK